MPVWSVDAYPNRAGRAPNPQSPQKEWLLRPNSGAPGLVISRCAMESECAQLPFSLSVYQGWAEGSGIATATSAGLTLEFEIQDNLVGVLRSDVRRVAIPISELYSVALKSGWFRTKLLIRTRSMTTLSSMPGSKTGKIELNVARKDKRVAAELVSTLMLYLSEKELAELG